MKSILVLLAIFSFVSNIYCDEEAVNSDVIIITDKNADFSEGIWLVEFYAPWCGHCKHLAPTWEKVATELKGKVKVAKVDCTIEKDLGSAFSIRGYPTIKAISKGLVYEYNGGRSESDLIKFVTGDDSLQSGGSPLPSLTKPKVVAVEDAAAAGTVASDVVVLTDANFEEKTSKGVWLLEFYAPWCGHCKHLAPVYEQVATALKGKVNVGKVDCTVENAVARQFAIRGYPTITFLKDGKIRDYKGARTLDDFVKFVDEGWNNVPASPLPEKATQLDEILEELKNIERILKDKFWITVAAVFILGALFGKLAFGGSTVYVHQPVSVPVRNQKED